MNTTLFTQRILGIDPGTATTGYGVLDSTGTGGSESLKYIASGIIQTSKNDTPGKRLSVIRRDLIDLIAQFKPHVVSVESLFFFKNVKTFVPVAQALGVILEAAESKGLATFGYTPMQVKLNLTGFGRADKTLVQSTVMQLLSLPQTIRPDDAADAVAIAVCHSRMTLHQGQQYSSSCIPFVQNFSTQYGNKSCLGQA